MIRVNWLIRLLGGVTAYEFAEVFSLAAHERNAMNESMQFYKAQCENRQQRIDYLEDLILKKTGFVVEALINEPLKDFQPLGGTRNWSTVKRDLERKDHELVLARSKKDAR